MAGDLSLLVVQDAFHELTLQPHQSATAKLPTAEYTAISRLSSNAAALIRH